MNDYLMIGTDIVIAALIAYSIGIIAEQTKKYVSNIVISFLTAGVVLDITATIFMILGSSNTPFTLHGILGYSSLAAMLLDAILMWRHRLKHGPHELVSKKLHLYSRTAYIWWLLAFVTGGIIAMSKYM